MVYARSACAQLECASFNSTGDCSVCIDGYQLINGNCVKISTPSQGFIATTTTTTTTTSTTTITIPPALPNQTENNQSASQRDPYCIQSIGIFCQQCAQKYYKGANNRCMPVSPLCQTNNVAGQCTSCFQGYSLRNGKCEVTLPSDPNCKTQEISRCS